ncbi:MAG: PD-(D/E)XK nuclease family protein [Verrucomicrobiota bacterium]
MSRPPTFVIGEFEIRPESPKTWSFSALRGFEACPMQWALSRTVIPCFGSLIPQKPNRSSVEGTLLHELFECFERQTRNSNTEMFRPRRTLLGLVAAWAKRNASNPRIDSQALAGQVRIEEILRAFGEACSHVKREERQSNVGTESVGNRAGFFNGAESWLRDLESKLCGRADFISSGEIVDFKSGERHDHHAEQITFYGALYLALTGRTPTALRLVYTATNEILDVPVPVLSELKSSLAGMRRRAVLADQQVSAGELPAKPEPAKCACCHVRGLCDKYWQSLSGSGQGENYLQASVVDYAPTTAATIEPSALGVYVRDIVLGVPSALHLPQEVANKVGERVGRMRILALRANTAAEGVRFAFTRNSEVFVS